jgi:hypothetical protein
MRHRNFEPTFDDGEPFDEIGDDAVEQETRILSRDGMRATKTAAEKGLVRDLGYHA